MQCNPRTLAWQRRIGPRVGVEQARIALLPSCVSFSSRSPPIFLLSPWPQHVEFRRLLNGPNQSVRRKKSKGRRREEGEGVILERHVETKPSSSSSGTGDPDMPVPPPPLGKTPWAPGSPSPDAVGDKGKRGRTECGPLLSGVGVIKDPGYLI